MSFGVGVALVVLVLVVLFGGLWLLVSGQQARTDSFQRQCSARSGHIYQPDSSEWCLTTDGRFIEIYP